MLRLAVPAMLFGVLTQAFRSVDQFWVKDISSAAQAAVGASVFVVIAMFALFELPALGAAPLIARATGGNDPALRRRVLGAAIVANLLLCAGVMALVIPLAPTLAQWLGLRDAPAREFTAYVVALSATILPWAFTPLVDASFVAMGNTRLPMKLHALALGLTLLLTPLFIYPEAGGIPGLGLGIAGAALSANAARLLSCGLGFYALVADTELRLADLRVGPELRRVVRIGAPMSVGTLWYAGVYWFLLRTSVSPQGPHVNAALGIGFSALEGVTWPAFHGIGLAVSSVVGRALGAGRPDLARAAIGLALPLSTAAGFLAAAVFFFGGHGLTGLFTEDPLIHATATGYALALAWSQPFVAWETLAEGVLAGAGDTRTVAAWSMPLNFLRIPLAWILSFPLGWGPAGVWWAINFTSFAKALGKGSSALRGGWVDTEV